MDFGLDFVVSNAEPVDNGLSRDVLLSLCKAALGETCNELFVKIDGWNHNWESREFLQQCCEYWGGLRGEGVKGTVRSRCKSLCTGKGIGISDGYNLYWIRPEEFIELEIIAPIRLMAKGANFRVWTKKVKPMNDTDQLVWETISRMKNRPLSQTMNMYCNKVWGYHRFIKKLGGLGWIIRKEDRGNRFILIRKEWEQQCLRDLRVSAVPLTDLVTASGRIYFQPKVHKPGLKGRPIVSWIEGAQPEAKLIHKRAMKWLRSNNVCYVFSTDEFVDRVRPSFATSSEWRMSGDVSSLFTSVPRVELIEFLSECIPSLVPAVQRHLARTNFMMWGSMWKFDDGIDMGSKVSPALSMAFVNWKIRKRLPDILAIGGVELACYVDDLGGRVLSEDYQKLIEVTDIINEAVFPLIIQWEDLSEELTIMDCHIVERTSWENHARPYPKTSFDCRNRRFGLTRDIELPRSVWKNSIRSQLRRIVDREGIELSAINEVPDMWIADRHENDPATEYLGVDHTDGNCVLCSMYRLMFEYVIKKNVPVFGPNIMEVTEHLTWGPVMESRRGRSVLSMLRRIYDARSLRLCIRWRFCSMKLVHCICLKSNPINPLVTDDDPVAGVETDL